jgi:RimJ/RimL family protein N-acetyltransferase
MNQKGADLLRDDCVRLVQLEPEDMSDDYLDWLADETIIRYLEVRFSRRDRESVAQFVRGCLEAPQALLLGIRDVATDAHVGNIKVAWNPDHLTGDIGVMIGDKSQWSRGYASRAVDLLSKFALQELRLRKVIAGIYRSNVGSVRAFEKVGYRLEAVLREQVLLDGRPEDVLLFAIHSNAGEASPGSPRPAQTSEASS